MRVCNRGWISQFSATPLTFGEIQSHEAQRGHPLIVVGVTGVKSLNATELSNAIQGFYFHLIR